ncbi:MAG: 4-hydroxybenzoate octaprenyltransferase [Alphaproteobacteria bacterium]|nr:4-hydroxybenzoate octaprenyltransferase [Alphaproteobacteria bacterium]
MPQPNENLPPDSLGETLLMRALPQAALPYAKLARLDRPIGTWLLFWPCFWGLALAASEGNAYPPIVSLALFGFGALVMRGAGCTFNDIVDRNIDAKVARTAARPLPSGQLSLRQAWQFLLAQLAVGFLVLIQFNWLTIGLGVTSLVLVASYPFMKRFTYWPQFFLGLTFNWGALMGYTAINASLSPAALLLYAAGVFWTLGYDTIYAHQDREDDALIGVKSSALKLGRHTKLALVGFYGATLACLAGVGMLGGMSVLFWPALGVVAYHLAWQIYRLNIDDPENCLYLFRLNRDTGLIIGASILLGVF